MSAPRLLLALLLACRASAAGAACPCDCDGDAAVRVHELTMAVNIALERIPAPRCIAADGDGDGRVVVAELVTAVGAALHGCAPIEPTPGPTATPADTRQELEENLQRWQQLGLQSYRYRYQRFCFCRDAHLVDIEVWRGEIVSIRDAVSGEVVVPSDPDVYLTVPQLFAVIDGAIDGADALEVEYGATGAPALIAIDYIELAVDDELSFRVSDLRALVEEPCRGDADCGDSGARCLEPGGFRGCGICEDVEDECADDADCPGESICELLAPPACPPCNGPTLLCQPGCGSDADCHAAESCESDHRCRPRPCASHGDCPPHFDCASGGSRASTCARRPCDGDAHCAADGYCVAGFCYDEPGTCVLPPP